MIDLFRPFVDAQAVMGQLATTVTPGTDGRVYLGEGPKVREFERQFAELVGLETPLALNSCTSALDLALHLIGVGRGDEVITTPMTCTATNTPLVHRGAKIVWADVDPVTGLIDPNDVGRKITKRTKAILAVDWAGRSCDYKGLHHLTGYINNQADWLNGRIPIIQDAAHNLLGVQPDNRGDYVAWSFQAIKHLTTGDGGALLVPPHQYQRAKLLRWYGLDRESSADFRCAQNIKEVGYKAHMNDVAASIGLGNMPHMPWIVAKARQNAAWLSKALKGLPTVTLPLADDNGSWWLYTVLVDDQQAFIRHMTAQGVMASQVHARNDTHSAFSYYGGELPGVDHFAAHEVAIPNGWWLTEQDLTKVAGAVVSYAHAMVGA